MNESGDLSFMEMAFGLAARGAGRTSPNPCVGAVLVRDGVVVGYGHHEAAGQPHAEAAALRRADGKARGATLYVTLEPCAHWGRTPPCADALIQAGVSRVVAADLDPNPLVRGKGLRRLRAAGLDAAGGLLAGRNRRLNEHYLKFISSGRPFVTLKAAESLDGRLATRAGDSRWITGPAAREYGHLVRAAHDAILTGIGTVLRDDPLLSVRHPLWPGKRILRVVLDRTLKMPPAARMLAHPAGGPVLILAGSDASPRKRAALEKAGAEVIGLPARDGALDLSSALGLLGRRGTTSVLVEGGGRLSTAFLERRLADKVLLLIAPLLIGGDAAVGVYGGRGPAALRNALRLREVSSFRLGPDLVMEGVI